ncbi:MAG: ABC transporter substrate-binding protein [Planctomycetes bacterium]|nr:ABC transporter substrate-binding protein [Planctomycetota bacterium]
MVQKCYKFCALPIFIRFLFILKFVFCIQILEVTAGEIITPLRNTHASESAVIVIRSQQIAAYEETSRGFEEGCREKNISIKAIYDLKGDIEEGKRITQHIKRDKPNLILAVGVLAATIVKEQFPDIPIIFCMVINHERFNLRGTNITGISSEAPVENQFAILKELLGADKRVGVIYDPSKSGKIVSEAALVVEKFKLNLVKKEIASENEVASALKSIVKKIDVLWIIPDSTVVTKNSLDAIFQAAEKNHLPTFCTSSAIVKGGALISISPDYASTGLQASQIAQKLLNNPATTTLGIKQPDKLKITVNTTTAKTIGIDLSPLRSRTDIVLYP